MAKRWKTLRGWHTWVSLAFLVPLAVVAVTAMLFPLEGPLGLKRARVDVSWLPGYRAEGEVHGPGGIKAALQRPDGRWWIGTRQGLFLLDGDRLARAAGPGNVDVRQVIDAGGRAAACTADGLWIEGESGWSRVHPADAHGVSYGADHSLVLATKHEGLKLSRDGGSTWMPVASPPGLAEAFDGRVPLSKLVLDLHTGRALLGKTGESWWTWLTGASLLALAATGLAIWLKIQWHKHWVHRRKAPSPACAEDCPVGAGDRAGTGA